MFFPYHNEHVSIRYRLRNIQSRFHFNSRVSSTPDLCSSANLPAVVTPLNNLMRQFDDYAALASNTPQSQLVQVIPPMQAIRRAAQDQSVPSCLNDLKQYQLIYMDIFFQTLLSFMGNANDNTLNGGIAQAHQAHDQYTIELAHLLGLTVVVPPSSTPGPRPTQSTGTPPPPVAFTISNSGPNPLNIHVSASLTSAIIGTLAAGQPAKALGKSATGEWILIELPDKPGQMAWVYTTLVQFSAGNLAALPIVPTTP